MKTLRLGLAGFGTVGSGLAQILHENREIILARTGRDVTIGTVLVRDLTKKRAVTTGPGCALPPTRTTCWPTAMDVVVELMGGVDAALRSSPAP